MKNAKFDGRGIIGLLFLIIMGIVYLFDYFRNNKEVFLYCFVSVLLFIVVIYVLKMILMNIKRKKYITWLYDRNRIVEELKCDEFLNKEFTQNINNILKGEGEIILGNGYDFSKINELFSSVLSSEGVVNTYKEYSGLYREDYIPTSRYPFLKSSFFKISILNKGDERIFVGNPKITIKSDPLLIRIMDEEYNSYILYVFSEIILLFFVGIERVLFIGAYYHDALSLSYEVKKKDIEMIVSEKSKNDIRYYDKFCPISDTRIINSFWEISNKNGSRNIRVSPENNPLHFILEYGNLNIKFGDYSISTSFSKCYDVYRFVEEYKIFKNSLH